MDWLSVIANIFQIIGTIWAIAFGGKAIYEVIRDRQVSTKSNQSFGRLIKFGAIKGITITNILLAVILIVFIAFSPLTTFIHIPTSIKSSQTPVVLSTPSPLSKAPASVATLNPTIPPAQNPPALNNFIYTFDDASKVGSWRTSGEATNKSQVGWDEIGHSAKGSLKVDTLLWGNQSVNRPLSDDATHTEIVTYFQGSNASGKQASCWVYVPQYVLQKSPGYGYISLIVKSDGGNNKYAVQYGGKAYINDNYGKWFQLSLPIGVLDHNDPASQLDTQFDATKIAGIGVNIQAQDDSNFPEEQVEIYLDDCNIG